MKTNLFSHLTLAGLLLSAAVASGAAMAQAPAGRINDKPAVQHVVQHRHAQHKLHHVKHHRKVHHKHHHKHK
jgi:hypothetical protein